jgi:hypothetical protein
MAFRMRWRNVSLLVCSALVLAGCGGTSERLPVLTALELARIAERGDCGALVRAAIAAVNRHEVPAALQEQVLSDVQALAASCSPARAHELARRLAP